MAGLLGKLSKGLSAELEKQAEKALGEVVDKFAGGSGGGERASSEPEPPKVPLRSECNGRKRAVFIGINYEKIKGAELHGCHNDVKNVLSFLTETYGFSATGENVRILMDEEGSGHQEPTRANITAALRWLTADVRSGDSLFFHYSGHGGTKKDTDADEVDGFDETILPLDFQQTGEIIDDELHELLIKPLPLGVRLTAVFDSCHSGSVLDLPWSYKVDGSLEIMQIDNRKAAIEAAVKAGFAYARGQKREAMNFAMEGVKTLLGPKTGGGANQEARRKSERERTTDSDVIMFSGCRDSQTSADATIDSKPTGAASYALLRCLREDPHQTYTTLLKGMRTVLQGKYTQVPQLSTAHPMDLNVPFNM